MPPSLLDEYRASLTGKAAGTVDNYLRALTALTAWIATQPGSDGQFQPEHLTRTALQTYLDQLGRDGYSPSHRNPARRIQIEAQPLLAPRVLSPEQRYVLKNLVERADDGRGEALFALGYWAGCRVSDASHLRRDNVHLRARSGWVKVGYKGNKMRSIDLSRPAREALAAWLDVAADSPYVFTSQRGQRLTEAGIHHWLRTLKGQARRAEWELIADVSFHDLRHDFAHRARAAGWSLEEIAYYLGHTTKRGTPALQTTVRYTQASREQVRDKLRLIEG